MTIDAVGGPLAGLRVVDATRELGRYAGKVLAESGADVVRVLEGERGPDVVGPDEPGLLEWWHDNRCRVATIDLDDPNGAAEFRRLVDRADVLLDAEPLAVMKARGLGPDELAKSNPNLVHVSLSPQGSEGPRSDWRSSDLVAQALGGYLSVTGDPDRPLALWGRQAATVGGFYAAISALAGVQRARTTGHGSWVDLSLHESLVSCSEHLLMYWWFAEALAPLGAPIAARQRSLHWIRAFEVVPCQRGACMVSPAAGGLVGLIAWLHERGFAQSVPAEPNEEELLSLVPPLMEALHQVAAVTDATELFEAGQSLHVPFGEAFSIPQVVDCAQHQERGFFRRVVGENAPGSLAIPGPIAHYGDTPSLPPSAPIATTVDLVVADWAEDENRAGADSRAGGEHRPGRGGSASSSGEDGADPVKAGLPLAGLRVLDFTHVLAGPFATRVFADLGADVIRVQTEERSGGASANEFPYNVLWARGKRSIQLQMKHGRAMEVLQRMVEQADVVIDNFSAGVMESWGAGPAQLAAWNPEVISMSMSGCGADGPWQEYVTYAPTVHALCGFTALTGPDGDTDCGPGIAYNDHVSGLAGASALLAALVGRSVTGKGQHIDLSQLEIGTYLVGPAIMAQMANGHEYLSAGNRDPFADYLVNDVFCCADGEWLAVTVVDETDWARAESLGLSGGLSDLGGPEARSAIEAWSAGRSAAQAQGELQAVGLAAGMVQNAKHFAEDDEQLAHRDWLLTLDSNMVGAQNTERHPARWMSQGDELALFYGPSPYLGEHNFEVYEELLGWDAEQVAMAIGEELIM